MEVGGGKQAQDRSWRVSVEEFVPDMRRANRFGVAVGRQGHAAGIVVHYQAMLASQESVRMGTSATWLIARYDAGVPRLVYTRTVDS